MNKLEKLLFRKNSAEQSLTIWNKGINIYTDLIKSCDEVITNISNSQLKRDEARMLKHEAEIPLNHYITSFKLTKRELDNYILPEIEKATTEEERKSIDFKDMEKVAKELAKSEIFAEHSNKPANVELIEVNESIRTHISLLEGLIEASANRLLTEKDPYEVAKLKCNIFKWQLQITTNKKRLQEREEYYLNQFKPRYDAEMKECDKYLESLIERANEIVQLGIDMKLPFLLQEYEKNKEDKEKTWLFYTALKSRLNKIAKEMRKNKSQFKGKMHLAKVIVE